MLSGITISLVVVTKADPRSDGGIALVTARASPKEDKDMTCGLVFHMRLGDECTWQQGPMCQRRVRGLSLR